MQAKTRSSQSGPVVAPPLPTIVLNADSFGVHLLTAMYPRQVALVVSKMAAPSDDLLHRCHSHMNVKVGGPQLTSVFVLDVYTHSLHRE